MANLINSHRRAFHLPLRHANGGDPFVEARDENNKRVKVPNEGESFGPALLPGSSIDPKTRQGTPGRLEVPDWYLELLVKERGWARRLEHGGGVEVEGHGVRPGSKPAMDEAKALKRRTREAESAAEAFELRMKELEKRNAELERELAGAKTGHAPAAPAAKEEKPKAEKPKT